MSEASVDLSQYKNALSRKHQIVRFFWGLVWGIFARPLPKSIGSGWKRFLLRLFGAKVSSTAVVYSSAKVYYPANLVMKDYSCLASGVKCYNVAPIVIGANTTVSLLEDQVWVAAEAFVGMGVTVHEGAVIGARAVVVKDVEPWTVVAGNPAKFIKQRVIEG